MHQNRLLDHLRRLTRREMTRFRAFVFSPYFNKHEGVRVLVDHLNRYYPHFDAAALDRRRLFQVCFPGEAYDYARLAVLFTYAMRLLEQFFAQEGLAGNPGAQPLVLLRALRHRRFDRTYERVLKKSLSELEKQPLRNAAFLQQRFQLADEADAYYTLAAEKNQGAHLHDKEQYLDYFYLAEKLRDACELMVRRRIVKLDHHNDLLDAVLREVDQRPEHYRQVPAVAMYHQLYRLITRGRPEDYEAVRATLHDYASCFDLSERKVLYNYLQNFCIQEINRGRAAYLREVFHLYQAQLTGGLLIEEGVLSEWHYKNIVTTGIRLSEMEWVHTFIEQYRTHLHPGVRENAYRFNLANLHHARGEYDKVLELLTRVESDHPRYNLGAKALLLRTYYELDEFETLEALVSSFRQYLRRNRLLADFRRSGYANLFQLTRRAAHLKQEMEYQEAPKLQRKLKKLKQELQSAEAVFNKGWLEKKVMELENQLYR